MAEQTAKKSRGRKKKVEEAKVIENKTAPTQSSSFSFSRIKNNIKKYDEVKIVKLPDYDEEKQEVVEYDLKVKQYFSPSEKESYVQEYFELFKEATELGFDIQNTIILQSISEGLLIKHFTDMDFTNEETGEKVKPKGVQPITDIARALRDSDFYVPIMTAFNLEEIDSLNKLIIDRLQRTTDAVIQYPEKFAEINKINDDIKEGKLKGKELREALQRQNQLISEVMTQAGE